MTETKVLIAGGGIAGLTMALTLHQIGVPCVVFESVRSLKPLGVGINLQPNAVRELFDLGITAEDLDEVGIPAKEWALVGLNGAEIYSEPRGTDAGYNWPQYAAHRGKLHMLLARKVEDRLGPDALRLGQRITGYRQDAHSVTALVESADGTRSEETGTVLIGADGINSAIRAQMHPDQPPVNWGGAIMWRGTSMAKPVRTDSSFIGLGTHRHRMVIYPIGPADPETGLALINWIAELTVDNADGWQQEGWFRPVEIDDFIGHFEGWTYDWLDVPTLLRGADVAYENPMIDRDPIDTWADGRVILIGDAAHAMYPTGSNGASQAVIDTRELGLAMVDHGVTPAALAAFDAKLCGPVSEIVLRNRGAGPFGLLNMVNDRCEGEFDNIDDIIPEQERAEFMSAYKTAAGFAMERLNASDPILPKGATVR
ncbi:flavin-dependent oxidoreductase [Rhodobacterales bacterium HKCCE4037]|nr:flavin-dependent oxidoreductase [Rhodobacterales bacterium HKCCE4037]